LIQIYVEGVSAREATEQLCGTSSSTAGSEDLNGEPCLRLISALAVEHSEGWISGRGYLNIEELKDYSKGAILGG